MHKSLLYQVIILTKVFIHAIYKHLIRGISSERAIYITCIFQKVHSKHDSSESVFRPKRIVFILTYKLLQNYTGRQMPEKK